MHIRYSDEELDLLEKRARKCGVLKSQYIRDISLGVVPKEKPQEKFYESMKLLSSISKNMNQIATVANSYKFIDVNKIDSEIEKLNEFILDMKKRYL